MGIGPVRIGIVGCGNQAMEYYIPYLRRHCKEREDVEIRWISGYLEEDPRVSQIERLALETGCDAAPDDRWLDWLSRVDAVVISLPNVKHGPAIRAAWRTASTSSSISLPRSTLTNAHAGPAGRGAGPGVHHGLSTSLRRGLSDGQGAD